MLSGVGIEGKWGEWKAGTEYKIATQLIDLNEELEMKCGTDFIWKSK